jgi:E3 ubiquitin-protein ligase CHFR
MIEDASTNGTFLNGKKLGKGNSEELRSGDNISFLPKGRVDDRELIEFSFFYMQDDPHLKRKVEAQAEEKAAAEQRKEAEHNHKKALKFDEDISNEMLCCICCEFLYQCVTAVPCMHNFCGACMTDWVDRQEKNKAEVVCPQCRVRTEKIVRSAAINNLVEAYLQSNPEKNRSKESREEMAKKNKIANEIDYTAKIAEEKKQKQEEEERKKKEEERKKKKEARRARYGNMIDGDGYSDEEFDDEDDEEEDEEELPIRQGPNIVQPLIKFARPPVRPFVPLYHPLPQFAGGGGLFANVNPFGNVNPLFGGRQVCRECQVPGVGGFRCPPFGGHFMCSACKTQFPNRFGQFQQQCLLCKLYFCNLYWDCPQKDLNHLAQVQGHKLPAELDDNFFRGNIIEVGILRSYMEKKHYSLNDIFQYMINNVLAKNAFRYEESLKIIPEHNGPIINIFIRPETAVCKGCFARVWFQILFRYRIRIKKELDAPHNQKENCYFGINCPSMAADIDHAEGMDHICEQSDF